MADNAPMTVYAPKGKPAGYEAGGYGKGSKAPIGGKAKPARKRKTIAHGK